jgi:hypothetical protein
MARLLGGIALDRAEALLKGQPPENDAERDLVRRAEDAGLRSSA